ncbi:MAG TPA: GTP 3',8-cyclase MoaA [Dehalococcoidia bacterium]|nr:GTP 3',8-cyclase MoaA [Dehalococcoidia bacterium]
MTGLSDSFQRPINYLRVSITDRCNLRCFYCMPPQGIALMSHMDILTFDEIRRVAEAAAELGITKLRLSGGEPLVRLDFPDLVRMLAQVKGIDDLALTTNGVLLAEFAAELRGAGLGRVNVSLDSLRRDRFQQITGFDNLDKVLQGIERAKEVGLLPVKVNMVVMRGVNDDEIPDFARLTVEAGWHMRFIELMPFARATASLFVSEEEIRQRLRVLGELEPIVGDSGGPAKYYRLPGAGGTLGFISPVSDHFCFKCNRLRLTADGKLRPCLLSDFEMDLKGALRRGADREKLKRLIAEAVASKPECHKLGEGIVPQGRTMSQMGG